MLRLFLTASFFIMALSGLSQKFSPSPSVLVFSKTAGYRHESTEDAKQSLAGLCNDNSWKFHITEDSNFFTDQSLSAFDVIVFLLTSEDILDSAQQKVLVRFIQSGKGMVTVHSGSFTEMNWPWWKKAVCAEFTGHPPEQEGCLFIEERNHPATRHYPDTSWIITDEFYSFDTNPRDCARVLISIDEGSYDVDDNQWFPGVNQRMGDHPLVWCREFDGGRIFQTALGHGSGLYEEYLFMQHLRGAIVWAAGLED